MFKYAKLYCFNSAQALETATEKMNEMKLVMRKAISMDEDAISREEELMSRLCTENKVLDLLVN